MRKKIIDTFKKMKIPEKNHSTQWERTKEGVNK